MTIKLVALVLLCLMTGTAVAQRPLLAHLDRRHFDGQPSLSGHCGHGWTCSLPRPVAIDTRQSQGGTVKKCLHPPRLSAIIPILTAAGSHPDCCAVLIQIVALYHSPSGSELGRRSSQEEP